MGVYYPLATLPGWMQVVAHALPPSYVFEGMRAVLAGQAFPLSGLALGLGLAVLQIVLATAVFQGVHRQAVQSGLLARYSAESSN